MKVLEQDGYKYSREEFEGYKFRVVFRFGISADWRDDRNINIYTDNPNQYEVIDTVLSITTDKVKVCVMEHWVSKEQDDLTTQFIEETLKDI